MATSGSDRSATGQSFDLWFEFTPAEWHNLLQNPMFLEGQGNQGFSPRRLMGRPVVIVPPADGRATIFHRRFN